MRADEIRELGSDDITARVRELEEERFRLKFRSATEPLEDPLRLRVIRKDVARLKTILHERTQGIVREPTTREEGSGKGEEGKRKARRPAKKGATKTKAR
jgi:large subunit ribosomal protein L29